MKSIKMLKLFFGGLLLLAVLLGTPSPAYAQSIVTGDSVASDQVVDDDAILFGDNVVIDGDINGNVIAIGNTVTLNGKVNGSLFALAQDLNINGQVPLNPSMLMCCGPGSAADEWMPSMFIAPC